MISKGDMTWPEQFTRHGDRPSLFKGLDERDLQSILENSALQKYESGRMLVQQGDTPACVYFIIDGRVRTLRRNIDGDEATIRMLEPGETCMEAVLFMGTSSPIAVQTVTDSHLLLIPGNFMKTFVLQNSLFANNLLGIVTRHYKTAMQQIDALTIKTPVQRVGYYFLQKHLEQGSENMEFDLPFKKATIANHLGITPETFSRALKQIKKLGIDIEGEKIRLKDAYALCHFCDLDSASNCTLSNKDDCPNCLTHKKTRH